MNYVAVSGKMGTGKTTLCNHLNKKLHKDFGLIVSFASPIKNLYYQRELLAAFNIIEQRVYDGKNYEQIIPLLEYLPFILTLEEFDSKLQENEKPRKQFQFIGDFFKSQFGNDFWAMQLFRELKTYIEIEKAMNNNINFVAIDDLRYNIEFETIRKQKDNFTIIGIELKEEVRLQIIEQTKIGTKDSLNHSSETEVDDIIGFIKSKSYNDTYEIGDWFVTFYSTKGELIPNRFKEAVFENFTKKNPLERQD